VTPVPPGAADRRSRSGPDRNEIGGKADRRRNDAVRIEGRAPGTPRDRRDSAAAPGLGRSVTPAPVAGHRYRGSITVRPGTPARDARGSLAGSSGRHGLGRGITHSRFANTRGSSIAAGISSGFRSGGWWHARRRSWSLCFGFGWPAFCNSFYQRSLFYYGYSYYRWPSYCPIWWWPTWCYPVSWYRPVWWNNYCSYDYLYGYTNYAQPYDPAPVVIREVIHEPAAGIEVRRTEHRDSPGALAERFVLEGDTHFREGRYQDAADAYLQALTHVPADGSIHFVLSDALFALGDYHYAAYVIRKGLELEPDLARSDVDKRTFYGNPADFAKHLASLRDYISDHAFDAAAHLVLGYNLLFSADHSGAENALRRALDLNPGETAAKTFLDAIAARADRPDSAPASAPSSRDD
jgi:tetratricopeptide (TPR) repeat protein